MHTYNKTIHDMNTIHQRLEEAAWAHQQEVAALQQTLAGAEVGPR